MAIEKLNRSARVPYRGQALTHLQFIRRFTREEMGAFELTLVRARDASTSLTDEQRAPILVMGRLFESAQEIRTDDPDTIEMVHMMAQLGIIEQSRVNGILR